MAQIAFQIMRLDPQRDADIEPPAYMSAQAAGMDLRAAITSPVTIAAGGIRVIPTGFAMALPQGYEAQIRPRSGLAVRHGVTVVNAPGTIDADYRGEIKVALINLGQQPYQLQRGERMAQMIIQEVVQAACQVVSELPLSERGGGSFGHTGRF